MRRKITQETRDRIRAAEREKDMIYFLDFIPLNGIYQEKINMIKENRGSTLHFPFLRAQRGADLPTRQLDTARPKKTGLAGQLPNRYRDTMSR